MAIPTTQIASVEADGVSIFYRHAMPVTSKTEQDPPTVVLLHGFPASSFMFRNLLPLLAARGYRVIAPDLPGFGFTQVPAGRNYVYTFASLATTFSAFVDALGLASHGRRFALYVFDYGAPTGLRFALEHPQALSALVTQNGNAYEAGLGAEFWAPLRQYWATERGSKGHAEFRQALTAALDLPAIRSQYVDGMPDPSQVPPETYTLDHALARGSRSPGGSDDRVEHNLDLFYDYQTNVALYPQFHAWLRDSDIPVLAAWGQHDTIFVPAGAEAFRQDVRKLQVSWLDGGHFALETHEAEMAELMDGFFVKYQVFP